MNPPCLFCKIIQKEVPADIVYQDNTVTAFRDINPQAPVHILIIPNQHVPTAAEVNEPHVLGALFCVGAKLAQQENIHSNGYRFVINTGDHGGQTVHHLHLHLLGGRPMQWPPG